MTREAGVDEVEHFCLKAGNIETLRVGSYELRREFSINRLETRYRIGQALADCSEKNMPVKVAGVCPLLAANPTTVSNAPPRS